MKKLKAGIDLWKYVSEKGLKPQPKTSVSVWADNYRILSSGISAEPGRWKTSRAPYQEEIMNAFTQPGIQKVTVMSSSQIGKALKIDTLIPTPDGWKTIGMLKKGDKVFDENGSVCNVVANTEVMKSRPCYQIAFSDGAEIIADENHEWYVETGRGGTIKTSKELAKTYKSGKRYLYSVPVSKALATAGDKALTIKPYTLGVWLGDGNSQSAQITMIENDLAIAELGLINNKHIPSQYLRAPEICRWQLLQGIMDTDGYASKKGICEITLKSKKLIDGVSELLHSLGIKHTLKKKKVVCTNSPNKVNYEAWRISFTAYQDMPVFALARKQARLALRNAEYRKKSFSRRIINVKFIGYEDTKCIQVDSPSHLYLAGTAMIPTHNSDIMNNVIGRFAHLDPCPIMMIQPTIELAEDYSKSRISPMIRDTKVLNGLFYDIKSKGKHEAKTRDGNNTILSKIFPGGRLVMCGANSPAGLASRPVRILLADEVDRFPDSAGGEGDPVGLAEKRMTTFWNRVMGLFSTPTNAGESRIEDEYIAGTQEEWQYKCPNCGEYHALRYVDFETDHVEHKDKKGRKIVVVNDVKWLCPDCGFKFSEQEMKAAEQQYIPQNPEAINNGVRSFWLNAFSSPWLSWKKIMGEWLEAKGDPNKEKVVVNTRFGEPYSLNDNLADAMPLLKRREQYGAPLPNGVLLLTAGVDVQDNRLEYEVCGWGFGEECWGIVKGMILSRPDVSDTWAKLDEILDRVYRFADGKGLKVYRTFIDSGGHYTGHVYKYCAGHAGSRFPIKGYAGRPGIELLYKLGKETGCTVPLVILGVDDGKQQVFNRLAIPEAGDGYFHFGLDGDRDFAHRGYNEVYFKGLLSEEKRLVQRNGTLKNVWVPKSGVRNEPLDLRVYNLAAMQSCKPDWEAQYEAIYEQKPAVQIEKINNASTAESVVLADAPMPAPRRPPGRFSRKSQQNNTGSANQPRRNASSTQSYY